MNLNRASVALSLTISLALVTQYSSTELEELDNLLKNYDKRERPFRNVAPVDVKIQVSLFALGPISTKTFTLEADIFLREWWTDPRIRFKNGSIILNTNPSSFLWVPDMFILNSRETHIHKMLTDTASTTISSDGSIYLSVGVKASCSCNMNLQMFPMDRQTCSILFESYAFNGLELNPVWHDDPLEYDEKAIKVFGFTIRDVTTDVYNRTYSTGQYFPCLRVSFHLDRTFSYYFYRSYIPSIILVILSWGTFQIPATAYPARVTLIMSNFLANAFILQHASSEYTKVEYTTAIELFLLVNISFIMITMLEYMLVVRTNPDITLTRPTSWKSKCGQNAVKMRRINIQGVNSMYYNDNANKDVEKQNFEVASNNAQVLEGLEKSNRNQVPKLHNIDRLSQIIIPTMYILFNIVYFVYFLS